VATDAPTASAGAGRAPRGDVERELLLEVQNLEVTYDRVVKAVRGVSLGVRRGSITGIIGTNGAGKTTTLHAVAGLMAGDRASIRNGRITFAGHRIEKKRPHAIARLGVGLVPERRKIFPTLTVEENLRASLAGRSSKRHELISIDGVYELWPRLRERRRQVSGYLSGGERQMLAIAMGLLGSPDLLMIDEMLLGLSPAMSQIVAETVLDLRRRFDLTFLVVEQNAVLAAELVDYVYVMENGGIVFEGPIETLVAHADFREFYLGLGAEAERSYRDVRQLGRRRRWKAS
jgi:branched-chain amino acid transport system ATP-binding protein